MPPVIATAGAASARGFGFLTAIGQSYWLGRMENAGLQNFGYGTAVDSAGNMYICGSREASNNDFYLVKLSPQGTIVWQTVLYNTSTSYIRSVKVDSSGNVYVAGGAANSGQDVFEVAKYDSSGTLQWQRRFGNGAQGATAYGLALDASSNVYVGGRYWNGGTYDFMLLKYNSSGTIQWQQKYAASSYDCYGQSVAVDPSGNVYITGYTNISASWDVLLLKYDSSGTLLWQRKLGVGTTEIGNGVATDSSGNVYVCGYSGVTGANALLLAKYDSSGTVQWQHVLENGQAQGNGITIDSSNNIYVCGKSRYFGSDDMYVAKYNTSGTIQWQRRIGNNTNSEQANSVAVDSQGNVYLAGIGQVSGVWNILYAKLPADGSKTGTYTVGGVSYIYGTGALSDSTQTMTSSTPGYSSNAVSYTAATSTLTGATPSLTTSVTQI